MSDIEGAGARDVLAAIWLAKSETARRVRQRVNGVVDWAIGKGYRTALLPTKAVNKSSQAS